MHQYYCITAMVAFCSMSYELFLAHGLSVSLGQSTLRFATTIGLYLFSLGMGSLYTDRLVVKNTMRNLIQIEVSLAAMGLALPFLLFAWDAMLQKLCLLFAFSYSHPIFLWSHWIYAHILVLVIGFLSGIELPLLMALAAKEGQERSGFNVLGIDYLFTFVATVVFPLWLFPGVGLVGSSFVVAGINGWAAVWLILLQQKKELSQPLLASLGVCFLAFLFLYFEPELRFFISEHLILANLSSRS